MWDRAASKLTGYTKNRAPLVERNRRMHQVLFRLPEFVGGMPIYGFGLMMVVAFFAAMELAKLLARRSRIDPEIFSNAALIALAAGVLVLGCRTCWKTSATIAGLN